MIFKRFNNQSVAIASLLLAGFAFAFIEMYFPGFPSTPSIICICVGSFWGARRYIKSKPFSKEIETSHWKRFGDTYEALISVTEHQRGKTPTVRCFAMNELGKYEACHVPSTVTPRGNVVFADSEPKIFMVEIRQ